MDGNERSEDEKPDVWPAIRWAHRRRPLLTALIFLAALTHSIATRSEPADLMDPAGSWRSGLAWALLFFGVAVRLWGSGNLSKNQEITTSGVYRVVRHPLYVGSLALFLAYFITIGSVLVGAISFVALVGLVYYPTMLAEEAHLRRVFPDQYAATAPPPRLWPDLRRLGQAASTDQFAADAAWRNLGFRSAWVFIALPILLWLVARAQAALP